MAPTSSRPSEGEIDIEAVVTEDFTLPESFNIINTCEEIPLASFDYACDPIRCGWEDLIGMIASFNLQGRDLERLRRGLQA